MYMEFKRITDGEKCSLLLDLCGRLFHEYLEDMYSKVDKLRVNYIIWNEQKIRVIYTTDLLMQFLLEILILDSLNEG